MKQDILNKVRIIELTKDDPSLPKLNSNYSTTRYYDLSITHGTVDWRMELTLKTLEKPLEKLYTGTFFEPHVNEPRVFAVIRLAGLRWGMRSGTAECVYGNS
jgi:hypothetical protein